MSLTSYRAAPPRVNRRISRLATLPTFAAADGRQIARRQTRLLKQTAAIGKMGPPHVEFNSSLRGISALCRPGNDLLSRVLRHSTIGAEAFDGRVRDGIGSDRFAKATRPAKGRNEANGLAKSKSKSRTPGTRAARLLVSSPLVSARNEH